MRSTPLTRSTPLSRGPGPTRKSRQPLRRRHRRTIDRQAAEAWAYGIRAKACAVCGGRCGVVQGHHVLHVEWLRAVALERGLDLERLRWDSRNRLPVGEGCHAAHHSAARRIPRAVLREHAPKAAQMARELGLLSRLERFYPETEDAAW